MRAGIDRNTAPDWEERKRPHAPAARRNFFSNISITAQISLLGCAGILLTAIALSLSLDESYHIDLQARKSQIQALVESGVTTTEGFVALAQEGKMTTTQAQADALAVLSAARFDGGNYYFVDAYDGTGLAHPNKSIIGTNRFLDRDIYGKPTDGPMLTAAIAGHPVFNAYYKAKAGGSVPEPKISYMMAVPEWGWVLGTGLYVDDLQTEFFQRLTHLAAIFLPLFVAFVAIIFSISRTISGLLARMTHSMERLAQGQLDAEIPDLKRRDALGRMARAVQVFQAAGIEKQRLESQAEEMAARVAADRLAAEAERAAAAEQLQRVVSDVAGGLEKLAHGDLLFRLATPFNAAYEKLRLDFNAAMETLQATMQGIAANTLGVRSGAGEITQASDDLSRRTEQQAASLEETAAALDEITATVRRTAEGADAARQLAAAAKSDAERSGDVVRETVSAIHEIEASSKQIGSIIGVIDEIAFQTNLLALNAGIEAARAGDAGRGFAVVATEVRALAQRSADAAREIKMLISASGQQVKTGVRRVEETGKALEGIVAQVMKLSQLVSEIAASAQEQATGLHEVNSAVNQMDQVTQQNAAMVEQSTAASHGLAGEAEALARLIGQFNIGVVADTTPVRQPASKAPVVAPLRTGKLVAFSRAGTRPAAQNWDEF
jgi:methyl-accepting chemotaxis protein